MNKKIKSLTDAKLALALLKLDNYEPAAADLVKQEALARNMLDADMNLTPKHQESEKPGLNMNA